MKKSGYIVETKSGKIGRTYHDEALVNGKQPVHIEVGEKTVKMLCDPNTLKFKGFVD